MRNTRRILLLTTCAIGLIVATSTPARAQAVPSIADQPAATLLLPYFEVDLAHPAGPNTLFSINNASATAVLAHVTIWTSVHVPVQAFNVYLTGYDLQTINMRDILNGRLPQTASDGQDPTDVITPQGPFSQDINYASCTSQLPPATLPQSSIDHMRAVLTGNVSPLAGLCASVSDGTQVARGYVTVDTVSNCTTRLPSEPGYFVSGGVGDATNQNVLWGDYVYTNHLGGAESGDASPLVHIRANAADAETNAAGQYTFYGRLVNWSAADNREPLATTFGVRYVTGTNQSTTLTVWRDSKINQGYFACGSRPSWYPLSQESLVFFDEQERPEVQASVPFAPQPPQSSAVPFGAGAQRVRVGDTTLPTSYASGWLYLNLNTTVAGSANPAEDATAAQAWVSVHLKGNGRYSVGWPAVMFDSAKAASHLIIQ